jgi:hypothetical protein
MAELFKWPPQFHEEWTNTEEWKTVVSRFENHVTQRRSKWSRRYGRWRMSFSKEVATNSADAILDFFNARYGSAQYFYLPSWKGEFRLLNNYTAGGASLTLESTSTIATRLTSTVGQRGNFVHISSDDHEGSTGDVFQITNINSNVLAVTRVAGSNSSYTAGTLVNLAYEVYFDSDNLTEDNIVTTLYKIGVDFTER